MGDVVAWLLDTAAYPARWACGNWSAIAGWLHIVSDVLIFLSYTAIPLVIAFYVRRRREVQFTAIYWLFCAFIFGCGSVHLVEAVIFYHPLYNLSGVLKATTAVVSIATVVVLFLTAPRALAMPGLASMSERLQEEVFAHQRAERELASVNASLYRNQERLLEAQRIGAMGDWEQSVANGAILHWSEQLGRIFECGGERESPQTAEAFRFMFGTSAPERDQTLERVLASGDVAEHDLRISLPSGRVCWVKEVVTRKDNGHGTTLRGVIHDITQRKEAELALAAKSEELEQINEELEQYASVASHDLQEPLRKVRFYASCLQDEDPALLSPDAVDSLHHIDGAVNRMQILIKDLLAYSRVGIGDRRPVRIPMRKLVEEEAKLVSPDLTTRSDCRIDIADGLPDLVSDEHLMRQLFRNLLANSVKYRHPDRSAVIRVSGDRLPEGGLEYWVEDNGIGFDQAYSRRIFKPFERLHSRQRYEGTGIGLAICRRIVEQLGGSIEAYGKSGRGARFRIWFPNGREVAGVDAASEGRSSMERER